MYDFLCFVCFFFLMLLFRLGLNILTYFSVNFRVKIFSNYS